MNIFKKLLKADQIAFLKFLVYISLLAANQDGRTDEQEIKTAIDFDHNENVHLQPFACRFL